MEGYQPNQTLPEAVTALQNCISIFLDQLSAERDLLLNGQADQLPQITESKQQTLHELVLLETQIRPHLASLTKENNKSIDSSHADYSIDIGKQWNNVVELLSECQKINSENGSLVNTLLKQTKNALGQLHALSNVDTAVTYNKQGSQQYFTESNRSVHV